MATLKNTVVNDTGYLKLPAGTDAQRPGTPQAGMMRWNTTSSGVEVYNGTSWSGVGSSDADTLDGQHGTYYLDYNNFTNTPTVPTATSQLTNDSNFAVSSYDNDFYANAVYADNWFRPTGNAGLYFQTYGTGITSVNAEGGQYGSVATYGGIGGWEGFSIGGRAVFMHNMSSGVGIYNDVNNEWMIYGTFNGGVDLRYNGTAQLCADNGYGHAPNQMRSPIYYDSNNTGYYVDPASTSNFNTICAANYYGLPASGGGMCMYYFIISCYSSCTINPGKPVAMFAHVDGQSDYSSYFVLTCMLVQQNSTYGYAYTAGNAFTNRRQFNAPICAYTSTSFTVCNNSSNTFLSFYMA